MRKRARGSATVLAAAGALVLIGGYTYLAHTVTAQSSKFIGRYEGSIEGFYWSEIALAGALKADRDAVPPTLPLGVAMPPVIVFPGLGSLLNPLLGGPPPSGASPPGLVRRLLRLPAIARPDRLDLTADLSLDNQAPLAFLKAGNRELTHAITPGAPPKSVCGESQKPPQPANHLCVYRAHPVPPNPDPRIQRCAQKLAQKGIVVPPDQLAAPRVISRNLLVGIDILTGPIVDNVVTTEPAFVFIEVNSLVNVLFSVRLLNPKGLYCLSITSLVNVFVNTQLHCSAELVSSETRTMFDLFPSTTRVGTCP